MALARPICLAVLFACVLVERVDAGTLSLTWDANTEPNVTGYVLSIGTSPGQYSSTVDVGKQTSYSFTEPDATIAYYFAIRAYNSSGLSSTYSTEVQSTPASTPTAPLTVMWDANTEPNLGGYVLSIGTLPGQYTTTINVRNTTSYQYAEPDPTVTYYFAVRAYNTSGVMSPFSIEVQSTPLVNLPTVTTGAATAVSVSGATLNGVANPSGTVTSGFFEYGVTTAYGSKTPLVSLGSGTQAVAIPSGAITNLSCNTGYNFRAVALNSSGAALGGNAALTTSPCPSPTVTTGSAMAISTTGATLTATVDTHGAPTTAAFQYGKTVQYGLTTGGSTIASGIGSVAIPAAPLSCGTLYHYRAVAITSTASGFGADATLTTLACMAAAPTITVQPRGTRISAGGTAQLSVQATGTAPLAYQWYRGASGVMTDPMPGATGSVFVTPPLNSDTSFWVRVSNAGGAKNSTTAVINVRGKK